jgi:hypothetical protein
VDAPAKSEGIGNSGASRLAPAQIRPLSSGNKIHSSFPVKCWFQNADLLYNVSFDSSVIICSTSDWVSGLAADQ